MQQVERSAEPAGEAFEPSLSSTEFEFLAPVEVDDAVDVLADVLGQAIG